MSIKVATCLNCRFVIGLQQIHNAARRTGMLQHKSDRVGLRWVELRLVVALVVDYFVNKFRTLKLRSLGLCKLVSIISTVR